MNVHETAKPAASGFTDAGTLACTLDKGVSARAAIGLVVLATDQTMEHEFRLLLPRAGVGIYSSRVWNDTDITPETLRAIVGHIAPATRLILPGSPLHVVGFGCTSATMTVDEEAIFAEIRKERPEVACTTPVTAALAAFRAMGAERIAVLTPYAPDVNAVVRQYLEGRGVNVCGFATFDKRDDRDAARISLDSVAEGVAALARAARPDAIFVSCTSVRIAERITSMEAAAGVPVTSSNHAMAWHTLRLAGVDDLVENAGRLFTLPLAS